MFDYSFLNAIIFLFFFFSTKTVQVKRPTKRKFLPSAVGGLAVTTTAAASDKHSTACNMVHVRAHTTAIRRMATAVTPCKSRVSVATDEKNTRKLCYGWGGEPARRMKERERSLFPSKIIISFRLHPSSRRLLLRRAEEFAEFPNLARIVLIFIRLSASF